MKQALATIAALEAEVARLKALLDKNTKESKKANSEKDALIESLRKKIEAMKEAAKNAEIDKEKEFKNNVKRIKELEQRENELEFENER